MEMYLPSPRVEGDGKCFAGRANYLFHAKESVSGMGGDIAQVEVAGA